MIDYLLDNFEWLLIGMSIAAAVVFVCLFFVDAGYGKFYTRRWGPSVGNRLGWVLMELPAFVLMLVLYLHWETPPACGHLPYTGEDLPLCPTGTSPIQGRIYPSGLQPPPIDRGGTELSQAGRWSPVPLVFLLLFELHYFQRSLVFPFLLRGKSRMPLAIVLLGVVFNSLNAFMQAGWLFCLSKNVTPYPYTVSWLLTPQFIAGTLIFLAGMGINLHSDHVIRQLRRPGDTRHYLPSRGLYSKVTSANYFGELVEWCGFAILTWSWSGAVFALWTFANLAPRAYRIHKRYQNEFPEQMAAHPRKRMIPYVWTLLPLLLVATAASAQPAATAATTTSRKELLPYGNFERWTVRDIKESGIIGGKTRRIYNIGPTDTIRQNKPYPYTSHTPWSSSNAYARVAGVTKTSCTVTPDRSWDGTLCAKLETKIEELHVIGINIKVLVSGSIFFGNIYEPIPTASNPYSLMNWGTPFTRRPKALVLDYKSAMPNRGTVTKCTITSNKTLQGSDAHEVTFILQKRWEDADGNIHALRVGTAMTRISQPTAGWVKDFRVPVIYGDATRDPRYKDYMKFGPKGIDYYARNSKGKIVKIQEEGWADANATPTHAMLMLTASIHEAFVGTLGNTLWVDNIAVEY